MKSKRYKHIIDRLNSLIKHTDYENHLYAVGGCVRDYVMHNDINDIDLVCDLPNGGIQFAEWLKSQDLITHYNIFPTYGTAMFVLKEFPGVELEIVQTRKEQYHDSSSRNPETSYGTLLEDCMRRDLTINALYFDITNHKLLDPSTRGLHDIENHIIDTTGKSDDIFNDDPLRILRVIRFAARFGYEIIPSVVDSIKTNAYRLEIISKERITDELSKMLVCHRKGSAVEALNMIKNYGLMKYIIPELEATFDLKQNKYHVGPVWEHTMKLFTYFDNTYHDVDNELVIKLGMLLHDIGKIETQTVDDKGGIHFYEHEYAGPHIVETVLKRLKFSNDIIESVKFIVGWHMFTKNWGDYSEKAKPKSVRKLFYRATHNRAYQDLLNELIIVIDCDNNAHVDEHCIHGQFIPESNFWKILMNDAHNGIHWESFKLPINGNDIMEFFNIEPGPKVEEYLKRAWKMIYGNPHLRKDQLLRSIKIK